MVFGMNEIPENLIDDMRSIAELKKDKIQPNDLLLPHIRLLINCTPLTEQDREFAELRYIQGKSAAKILDHFCWYSKHTFTRHNKKVWAMLVHTLMRLVGIAQY